ncbi:MAG: hypothetical protein JO083_05700 [Candidatus Eremiobacteraeota bacterium]|nr:hypothetical protein [Candidatus Eremiobacteraeota bacterium]
MAPTEGRPGPGEVAQRVIPTAGGSLINAAQRVLSDGHERDAGQILAEAVKAGLLPPQTRRIKLYTSLYEYVQRNIAHGRRPLIVQNEATHAFRINHPVDDWPDVELPAPRPWLAVAQIDAIANHLHTTSTAAAPEAFEKAVCDAFAAIGFVATHVGGNGAPDGLLDAPLGPLAYRAVLECKTAHAYTTVLDPRLEEPARFREPYNAQYAILVGPAFSVDGVFEGEMKTHAISVWSVNDVVNALHLGVDLAECRDLFAAGVVEDRLADLSWSREHGARKRLAVIAKLLHEAAWKAQQALVGRVSAVDAPALTVDAALMLVDTALQEAKATGGASRDEVETVIADLVRSGAAMKLVDRDGVVLCCPPAH